MTVFEEEEEKKTCKKHSTCPLYQNYYRNFNIFCAVRTFTNNYGFHVVVKVIVEQSLRTIENDAQITQIWILHACYAGLECLFILDGQFLVSLLCPVRKFRKINFGKNENEKQIYKIWCTKQTNTPTILSIKYNEHDQ